MFACGWALKCASNCCSSCLICVLKTAITALNALTIDA